MCDSDSLCQSRLHRRAAHRALHRRFAGNTHCQLHSCAAIGNFLLNASGSQTPRGPVTHVRIVQIPHTLHTLERGQKRIHLLRSH